MDTPSASRKDAAPQSKGLKRPTASLLPAFEPFSSSPGLPRPLKRTRDAFEETRSLYPTPVPTSSTAILSSSPPRRPKARPSAHRSLSTLSERAPLGAVPSITLNEDGTPIRLGRSSASCDYQFASNRLISRVHVVATYKPAASRLDRDRVEILCSGWNGIRIHCQSQVYEVKKGDTFSSDIRDASIMLDVHDSRVTLQWPEKAHLGPISSDEDEDGDVSTIKTQRAMRRHSTPPSPSPYQSRRRAPSPLSPSPAVQALLPSSPPMLPVAEGPHVEIYEDPELPPSDATNEEAFQQSQEPTQTITRSVEEVSQIQTSMSSEAHDFSDNDEENDPIIHSFGPFGANLLPRMAAINAADSPRPSSSVKNSRSSNAEPLHTMMSPPQRKSASTSFDVKGHIVNQLAFSRLSSTPLSTIFIHLPSEANVTSKGELKQIIQDTKCIGEVRREGKDAAGKRLESEFYYIPDEDDDEGRKAAIVDDLRKPGLRACRKQHKVSKFILNVMCLDMTSQMCFCICDVKCKD